MDTIHTPAKHILLLLGLVAFSLSIMACSEAEDALEEAIDGEETTLKEAELPNTSKVITCCDKISGEEFTPDAVKMECETKFKPAANTIIDLYQTAKTNIQNGTNSDQNLEELKTTYQSATEPGAYCFLDSTVGPIGTTLLPKDCEVDDSTVTPEQVNDCDAAVQAMLDTATNPPSN